MLKSKIFDYLNSIFECFIWTILFPEVEFCSLVSTSKVIKISVMIFLIDWSHHCLLYCVMVEMWKLEGVKWQLLHGSAPPNCRCGGNQFGGRQPQPSQPASAAEQHTSSASQLVVGRREELFWWWALENVDIKILLLYHVGGVWLSAERRGSQWSHLHLTWWLQTAATPPPPPPPPSSLTTPVPTQHHHKQKDCTGRELTIKSSHW